jgi:hypothetical protein
MFDLKASALKHSAVGAEVLGFAGLLLVGTFDV